MSDQPATRASRRPIDLLRNAGGVMEVGTAKDGPIVVVLSTKDKLYFIKTRAIYSVRLADQIDPNRQNPDIPKTQQRELPFGSEHFAVARILLTAEVLFKKTALGQSFDVKQGIELTIDLLKDIAAVIDIRERLEISQQEAATAIATESPVHRMLRLPSVDNLEARCDAFAQKAAHVVNGLERLAKIFYPTELTSKWIDALNRTLKQREGDASAFAAYMAKVRPFLMFVLVMRNMIEHPKPNESVKVDDFRLLPSGELAPPSVEIVRPDEPVQRTELKVMMETVTQDLVNVCEALLAYLCGSNVNVCGAFASLRVIQLPPEQRQNPQVRFSYGYYNGQTMIPISVG
jgi:hypothetical protein